MHQVTLSLRKDEQDDDPHRAQAEFTQDDIGLLKRFLQFVVRLNDTTLIRRGMPQLSNVRWTSEKGLELECASYTNPELYEILHVLRPLILKNEATSFHNISALLNKRFKDERVGSHLKFLRKLYEDGELSLYMQIEVGDQPLFDDSILRLWLNSEEYHADPEKMAAWEPIKTSLRSDNTRALVMALLCGKVCALFDLAKLVELITRDRAA